MEHPEEMSPQAHTPHIWQRLLQRMKPLFARMALATLLGVLTIACGIGLLTISAYLISAAALHPAISALAVAIVGVRVFGILRGILRYLERLVAHDVTFRLLMHLRVWFYRTLEPLAPARLLNYMHNNRSQFSSGDLFSRLVGDIEVLQEFYIRCIAPPFVAAITGLFMWLILNSFNPRLGLTLLAFFLLAALGIPFLTYALSRHSGQKFVNTRSALNMSLIDSIQGLGDLLAFGHEEVQMQRVQQTNRQLVNAQTGLAFVGGLRDGLTILFTDGCIWVMMLVAIPLVRSGQLNGVWLALLALAVIGTFEATPPLAAAAQQLGSSITAARRLFSVIDAQPAVADRPAPSPTPVGYDLTIQQLSFRYTPDTPYVLDKLQLSVPQGHFVALVGPSGAGKTTILNLLLRFWEYDQGSIILGGHELRNYQQHDIHRIISVVEQHTHLFNVTVRENLLIASPDATETDIDSAIQQAQLNDLIASLPQGLDTRIGEQGLKLSAGERQRIAIARALLQDAPVLLLDEPTANLDLLNEQNIMQALHRLARGKTTLLITHRLTTVEKADEILVLQHGKIREHGTHHELLQLEGVYQRLWTAQKQEI